MRCFTLPGYSKHFTRLFLQFSDSYLKKKNCYLWIYSLVFSTVRIVGGVFVFRPLTYIISNRRAISNTNLKSCKPHEPVQSVVIRWNETRPPAGVTWFAFKLIFFPDPAFFIRYYCQISSTLEDHFGSFFCYTRERKHDFIYYESNTRAVTKFLGLWRNQFAIEFVCFASHVPPANRMWAKFSSVYKSTSELTRGKTKEWKVEYNQSPCGWIRALAKRRNKPLWSLHWTSFDLLRANLFTLPNW